MIVAARIAAARTCTGIDFTYTFYFYLYRICSTKIGSVCTTQKPINKKRLNCQNPFTTLLVELKR